MMWFIGVALLILIILNGYIVVRVWSAFGEDYPRLATILTVFVILSILMFFLTRWFEGILPYPLVRPLYLWSVYWIGFMYYTLMGLIIIDIVRLFRHIFPQFFLFQIAPSAWGGLVFAVVLGLMVYGTWNARHPIINEFHLELAKKNSQMENLRAVMVSDIHWGWVYRVPELKLFVERINALEPDIVFLVGDLVDEGIDLVLEQQIPVELSRIEAPLGIYAVMGNHEYISGQQEQFPRWLKQAGIHVLKDEWEELDQGLLIIGREDVSRSRESGNHSVREQDSGDEESQSSGNRRLRLEELLSQVDLEQWPAILLDHQPGELVAAGNSGIDLQLSGHTHRGQFFPNSLVTKRIFAQDWGYYEQNGFQAVVSSGYGTWGPPIRIGSVSEIVVINITFTE
jgi:predicted MPP superfamily phosphohydrolase